MKSLNLISSASEGLSQTPLYILIVFKYVNLIPRKKTSNIFGNLGRSWIILGIWGAKAKYFQGAEEIFSGVWGEQCIISRKQGNTDPLGASSVGWCPMFVFDCLKHGSTRGFLSFDSQVI